MFPQGMVSFTRRKKRKNKKKEEQSRREKGPQLFTDLSRVKEFSSAGMAAGATKYSYKLNVKPQQKTLGVSSDYKFNWFIGGADTCQGDSGGPIWRNIKVT